jgi:hypothetical protein
MPVGHERGDAQDADQGKTKRHLAFSLAFMSIFPKVPSRLRPWREKIRGFETD